MGDQLKAQLAGHIGLRTRILLIALAILIVATAGAITTSSYLFIERLTQAQQSRAEAIAKGLHTHLQRLLSLGIGLTQLQGFEVQCREAVENNEGLSQAMVILPDGQILFHNEPNRMAGNRISDTMVEEIARHQNHFKDEPSNTYFALLPIDDDKRHRYRHHCRGFPVQPGLFPAQPLDRHQHDRLVRRHRCRHAVNAVQLDTLCDPSNHQSRCCN